MNRDDIDGLVERMLKEPEEHIDDAGFTARVMANIPAAGLGARARACIIGASVLLGSLVGGVLLPGGREVMDALLSASLALSRMQAPSLSAVVVLSLVAWGVYAFVRSQADEVR